MTVIYKKVPIESYLESAKLKAMTRGSRKNLRVKRCLTCGLLFETLIRYEKQRCQLCRYEDNENGKEYLESYNLTEEEHYNNNIAKGIILERNKWREIKSSGIKVVNLAFAKRLENYKDYMDDEHKLHIH